MSSRPHHRSIFLMTVRARLAGSWIEVYPCSLGTLSLLVDIEWSSGVGTVSGGGAVRRVAIFNRVCLKSHGIIHLFSAKHGILPSRQVHVTPLRPC